MTPEQEKQLQEHIDGIAQLLYEEAQPEDIETLAGIEKTIRKQTLEQIAPRLGIFLSTKSSPTKPEGKEK